MEWIERYKVVLFDFDGLLVDTEPLHFAAYIRMAARRGVKITWSFEEFCQRAHRDAEGLQRAMKSEYAGLFQKGVDWPELYADKKEAMLELLKEWPVALMPGAGAILDALEERKKAHAVVTHSPLEQVACIREKELRLRRIPVWITREDYVHPKPHPDCYLKALEHFGFLGSEAIGFEDSMRGLIALQGAKIDSVLICSKDHPQLRGAALGNSRYSPSLLEFVADS